MLFLQKKSAAKVNKIIKRMTNGDVKYHFFTKGRTRYCTILRSAETEVSLNTIHSLVPLIFRISQ